MSSPPPLPGHRPSEVWQRREVRLAGDLRVAEAALGDAEDAAAARGLLDRLGQRCAAQALIHRAPWLRALQAHLRARLVRPGVAQRGRQPALAVVAGCPVEPRGHVVHDDHHESMLRSIVPERRGDVGEHPGPLRDVVGKLVPEVEGDGVEHQRRDPGARLEEGAQLLHRRVELSGVIGAADVHPPEDSLQLLLPSSSALRQQGAADLRVPPWVQGALGIDVDSLAQRPAT
mmetsp:Transcript_84626/g.224706  ORF Transcript_84626/g.224706 Transcript_84626/m.224706 type:complete len:231 (+) Transcript_84626:27-719(+)